MTLRTCGRFAHRFLAIAVVAFAACFSPAKSLGQNRIWADFTTSMGNFTCVLDYTNAPRAVANFIGLATGQKSWLDSKEGRVRTDPFYNGITFHRVIANFMIQTGSRDGTGSDGPGYAFLDEFSGPASFNAFGMLAMANSGTNSNGAQFFVTVAPTTWLNGKHTIFGRVTAGSNVVFAISRVPTSSDRPVTDVILQNVSIRYESAAAQAFNIHAQGLPVVTNLNARVTASQGVASITFSNRVGADTRRFSSTNLLQWTETRLGIETAGPVTNSTAMATTKPIEFVRMAQVNYPSSTFAPRNLLGRTLALTFDPTSVLTIQFNGTGTGNYTYTQGSPGTVGAYSYRQEPYRGLLSPIYFSTVWPMTLELGFTSSTGGSFTGNAYEPPAYTNSLPVAGTFSVTP